MHKEPDGDSAAGINVQSAEHAEMYNNFTCLNIGQSYATTSTNTTTANTTRRSSKYVDKSAHESPQVGSACTSF